MRLLALPLSGLLVLAASSGCSPARGFCEASADCDSEVFGFEIDAAGDADDDVAVCEANQETTLRALRANEEEACHDVANAYEAYLACVGNAFAGGEDGCEAVSEECENEFEDFQDASSDVDGDECTSNEE